MTLPEEIVMGLLYLWSAWIVGTLILAATKWAVRQWNRWDKDWT